MHNPSHPGLIIRDDVLPDLQISVNQAAEQLGVSRVTLSRVINGRSAITAEMALRVGKWVGNGPEIWLRMQGQYDLWQARKKKANRRSRRRSGLRLGQLCRSEGLKADKCLNSPSLEISRTCAPFTARQTTTARSP